MTVTLVPLPLTETDVVEEVTLDPGEAEAALGPVR